MAIRKPLVSVSGQQQELPSGDVLRGERQSVTVFDGADTTSSTSYVTVTTAVINFDRLGTGTPTFHWFQAAVPAGPNSASVRLRNITDATNIFETTGIATTGLKSAAMTMPTGVKQVALQHLKTGGSNPEIRGGTIHVSVT